MRAGESELSLPGAPEPPHQPGHPPATRRRETRAGAWPACPTAVPGTPLPRATPAPLRERCRRPTRDAAALPRRTRDRHRGFPAPHLRGAEGRDGSGRVGSGRCLPVPRAPSPSEWASGAAARCRRRRRAERGAVCAAGPAGRSPSSARPGPARPGPPPGPRPPPPGPRPRRRGGWWRPSRGM